MNRLLVAAASLSLAACGVEPAGEEPGTGGEAEDPSGDQVLIERAVANLARIAAEIDGTHLASYGLEGDAAEQFFQALELEYADAEPDQLAARLRALASMTFFAAPDILPPAGGTTTPFHGLDMDQLDDLMAIEDEVWDGASPLSVCETTYLIERFVRPRRALASIEDYRAGYRAFAATCLPADLAEWYAFRGAGALRPSWTESNVMDRFLRRMAERCRGPDPGWEAECARWDEDRLAYRLDKNREFAARFLHHDPAQEARLADTADPVVLFEDRTGDGVAEFLMNGPASLMSGAPVDFAIMETGEFTGLMKLNVDGTMVSVRGENIAPDTAADLDAMDADPVRRIEVLVARHADPFQTYTSLRPDSASISSQPTPLFACTSRLGAAHDADAAGTPPGGSAGFIFLVRIPFDQILAAGDLVAGGAIDMERAWLDLATFAGPHEVAKLGAVPGDQIEGILVIRRPAAMDL